MKYLIKCTGFIGDNLFASSIAKKLHEQDSSAIVDYVLSIPQPLLLIEQNPYIRNVYVYNTDESSYDKVYVMPSVDQARPATIQFQEAAGVQNPTTEFDVYTVSEYDESVQSQIDAIREPNKPVVAWLANWRDRAYATTLEMYWQRIGGPHRDIDKIIVELQKEFTMIEVGLPNGVSQLTQTAMDPNQYAFTASIIKACDWMIGAEGGLTNLACAIGTRTIITTCFIEQLYGRNGHVKQIPLPQMGPAVYYPSGGHTHLAPFISDDEVAQEIKRIIKTNDSYKYEW